METFITFIFWYMILDFSIKAIYISTKKYPRIQEYSVNVDLVSLIIKLPFILWAAYLLSEA